MSYDTLQNGLSLIVDSEKVDFVDIDQSYQVRVTCVRTLPFHFSGVVATIWVCNLLLCELVVTSKFTNFDTERAQAI